MIYFPAAKPRAAPLAAKAGGTFSAGGTDQVGGAAGLEALVVDQCETGGALLAHKGRLILADGLDTVWRGLAKYALAAGQHVAVLALLAHRGSTRRLAHAVGTVRRERARGCGRAV